MAKKYDSVSLAKARYDLALQNQRPKFDKFNDFDYIFHSRLKKSDPNVPSKVFNPIIWSFIETIISRMLAKSPTIAYKPREDGDEEQAELLSQLFDYWFHKSDAFSVLSDFLKQALIYGTAIIKVDWYTSPSRVVKSYVTDPMTGEAVIDPMTGQFMTQEEEVVNYDDPRIQNVNIYDFFFDPNATTIEDAGWVIHQYYTTVEELEAINAGAPEPIFSTKALKELKDQADALTRSEQESYEQERRAATGYTSNDHTRGKGQIKIWEMWEDNKLCVVANESVVLREGENPYWHGLKPFIRFIDSSNTLEFYGKGEIEPVEKLIHALNTLMNQRIVNISQILNPVWKARPNVDDTELQFIPNTVIHVNDMNDADIMKQQDVTTSSFQEQSVIVEQIQRALGVTDYVQGIQTPGQTKAEVEIKTAQANARFSTKLMFFEQVALKKLGEIVYSLYQQFVTSEKIIRVAGTKGQNFVRLTPADLVGRFDVEPESGSTLEVDSEANQRTYMTLYSVMQGKPWINQMKLDEKAFKEFDEDPEEFMTLEEGVDGLGNPIGGIPGFAGQDPTGAPIEPEGELGVGQVL